MNCMFCKKDMKIVDSHTDDLFNFTNYYECENCIVVSSEEHQENGITSEITWKLKGKPWRKEKLVAGKVMVELL